MPCHHKIIILPRVQAAYQWEAKIGIQKGEKKNMKTKDLLAAVYFENRCYICHKKYGKGFGIHHIRYTPGEKTYKDFFTSESYHEYLRESIAQRPQDFALLCKAHHFTIEQMKRYKPDRLERLISLLNRSREATT